MKITVDSTKMQLLIIGDTFVSIFGGFLLGYFYANGVI